MQIKSGGQMAPQTVQSLFASLPPRERNDDLKRVVDWWLTL